MTPTWSVDRSPGARHTGGLLERSIRPYRTKLDTVPPPCGRMTESEIGACICIPHQFVHANSTPARRLGRSIIVRSVVAGAPAWGASTISWISNKRVLTRSWRTGRPCKEHADPFRNEKVTLPSFDALAPCQSAEARNSEAWHTRMRCTDLAKALLGDRRGGSRTQRQAAIPIRAFMSEFPSPGLLSVERGNMPVRNRLGATSRHSDFSEMGGSTRYNSAHRSAPVAQLDRASAF